MSQKQILLIDDHALFRCGLKMVLQAALPATDVIEAASLEDAMQLHQAAPSLILLDVQLQGINGIEGMSVLQRKWENIPVVMLSADHTDGTVREARRRGAVGFVSKADPVEYILDIVMRLLDSPVAPSNTGTSIGTGSASQHNIGTVAEAGEKPPLTPRQCEVLDLLSQGMTNKAIGKRLSLSENTIRVHVQAILQALQVENRSEAAFAARQRGLVR